MRLQLPNHPLVINHDIGGNFAIRKGPWKFILLKQPQLYNLAEDPKEAKDVAGEHPEIVQELMATLARYKSSGRSR